MGTEVKLTCVKQVLSSICIWNILRINFSKSWPVVDRRLIGRKFYGNFGVLARQWQSCGFGFLPRCRKVTESEAKVK
jgi:hypothetical protein